MPPQPQMQVKKNAGSTYYSSSPPSLLSPQSPAAVKAPVDTRINDSTKPSSALVMPERSVEAQVKAGCQQKVGSDVPWPEHAFMQGVHPFMNNKDVDM